MRRLGERAGVRLGMFLCGGLAGLALALAATGSQTIETVAETGGEGNNILIISTCVRFRY